MKYITENSTERLKELADYLPANSALINVADRTIATNINAVRLESGPYGQLTLDMQKDYSGQTSIVIERNIAAKQLYNIAEPDGTSWEFINAKDKAKYIRMQDAGITP